MKRQCQASWIRVVGLVALFAPTVQASGISDEILLTSSDEAAQVQSVTRNPIVASTRVVVAAIRNIKPHLGLLKPQDQLVHDLGFHSHKDIVRLFNVIVEIAHQNGLDVRPGDLAITPIPEEEFRRNYRITSADIHHMSVADLVSRLYRNSQPLSDRSSGQ